jgi:hypothetical protein
MPEPADDLTPARAEDLRACIAYALTSDGRLAKAQSAELMAAIVAERLIARLERDGFVIMRRPRAPGAGALGRGFEVKTRSRRRCGSSDSRRSPSPRSRGASLPR